MRTSVTLVILTIYSIARIHAAPIPPSQDYSSSPVGDDQGSPRHDHHRVVNTAIAAVGLAGIGGLAYRGYTHHQLKKAYKANLKAGEEPSSEGFKAFKADLARAKEAEKTLATGMKNAIAVADRAKIKL
ncbi:hypothetical protein FRB96_002039 [Tulasnella sp. 330]|nr:hypothetical protein FRB96_002039 [Tulasnella sp. 330]KAG8877438.1 hypothetical protein FRB97_003399 [Tulasnella sp. 331]KAG8882903.1 hypothetical protein FRB98_003399 [Tulasnella sp. 332]